MSAAWDSIADRIRDVCVDSTVVIGLDIGALTTYRVGGPAAVGVTVSDIDDLIALAAITADVGVSTLVIGRGSNLLVADGGFDGVAIMLGESFDDHEIDGVRVRAGGARRLPVLARATVRAGLTGFEWAVGVPGSIGGAVRMNAGGHGADMAASLVTAHLVDLGSGRDRIVDAADLDLGYRHSNVSPSHVVVAAELALSIGDRAVSERELTEIVRWRRENQPGGQNAGSVFTNPSGDSAGRLIDEAGCKGLRIGSASVSTKHANFIQADPGGSAADVVAVMDEVRRRVEASAGIELVVETRMVGFGRESS
ncbi:MAG: UDP-N-acetylmuramate dehydrogenase [Acidimicrobiia bacterium]|nr:UDP-N-acetylmuramate dehydrogenase [Acidimicrobiia bacterium]